MNIEIPEGYKQTEIGVIPGDWDIKQLEALGSRTIPAIKADPFGSSLTKDIYVAVGYKIYGQEQVIRGDYLYGDYFISAQKFKELESCAVQPGNILLSLVGTTGKLLVIPENAPPGIINPRLIRLSFDEQCVDPYFFKALFESKAIQNILSRNAQGGTMSVLNATILRSVKISLPPLPEQKAIAQALSDVDAAIAELDRLITKKRNIKQGTMQQLLTGKTRLPGFGEGKGYKKTEVGVIPEDWELKAIKELNFDISDGNYSSKYPKSDEFKITGVPFIRANNIGQMTVIDDDMKFISVDKHSQLLKGHLRKNDILITTRGDIGQIALVPDRHINSNINAQIVRINTKDSQIYSIYFAYFLLQDTLQKIIISMQTGSALKQLPVSRLTTLAVAIPPLPEQKAIAQILSDMDTEIEALEQKRNKYKAIKQGMMQELLTGRTRLI
jgi:type I restriction enzyme S subunit